MALPVPVGYTSPDIIDRRNGQNPTPSFAERLRDLVLSVQHDYQESGTPAAPSPYGPTSSTPMMPQVTPTPDLQQVVRKTKQPNPNLIPQP